MFRETKDILDRLAKGEHLPASAWQSLLEDESEEAAAYAKALAREVTDRCFGRRVYLRGLIEFTSYCRQNCYYCGLRSGNTRAERFRLTEEEILACCRHGYEQGLRTFVLQGGEDPFFTEDKICRLVALIRETYPEAAVTLSIGEWPKASYQRFFEAGADRYLLRHETANEAHYRRLHPAKQRLETRKRCLYDLKDIGFQVGAGMMIGSPGQTVSCLAEDFLFLDELRPHMVGTGPFIHHRDTPFRDEPNGSTERTYYCLSLLRLLLPEVLLPATTALGTLVPGGRERGIEAGCNVIMPAISPAEARAKYLLYDGKVTAEQGGSSGIHELEASLAAIGYRIDSSRGDAPAWHRRKGVTT